MGKSCIIGWHTQVMHLFFAYASIALMVYIRKSVEHWLAIRMTICMVHCHIWELKLPPPCRPPVYAPGGGTSRTGLPDSLLPSLDFVSNILFYLVGIIYMTIYYSWHILRKKFRLFYLNFVTLFIWQEANETKFAGVTLVTLSVGTWRNLFVLTSITNPILVNTILVDNITTLSSYALPFADTICNSMYQM